VLAARKAGSPHSRSTRAVCPYQGKEKTKTHKSLPLVWTKKPCRLLKKVNLKTREGDQKMSNPPNPLAFSSWSHLFCLFTICS
jgi:hypothetical protein